MTSFKLVAPPVTEPVALAEMKAHARIDTNADDALITTLIMAARQWAENYTRRAFITQTWRLCLDAWPVVGQGQTSLVVDLPRAPLQAVNSVQVYDDSDNATLWASGNYYVDTSREPGRLALRLGSAWPQPLRAANGIEVEYVAGYGDEASAVPETIRLAIKQIATHWYENRGEAVVMQMGRQGAIANQTGVNMPLVIQALLEPYCLFSMRL